MDVKEHTSEIAGDCLERQMQVLGSGHFCLIGSACSRQQPQCLCCHPRENPAAFSL